MDNEWQQVTDHSTGEVRVQAAGSLCEAMQSLGVDAGSGQPSGREAW
jgi:hypothetical protein